MNFCRPRRAAFENSLAKHVVGKCVGLFILQVGSKCTEPAAVHTDIRGVQMDVCIVKRKVAVLTLTDKICKLAEQMQVRSFIQKDAVLKT